MDRLFKALKLLPRLLLAASLFNSCSVRLNGQDSINLPALEVVAVSGDAPTGISITADQTYNSPILSSDLAVPVTLAATDTGPIQMCVGATSNCSSCVWEAFSTSKDVTVPDATGIVNLSAKFKDADGNTSACVSTTSIYEQVTLDSMFGVNADWTSWVKFYNQANDQECDGTEVTVSGETPCLHTAEFIKVVTSFNSCQDLSMTDTFGVFDWRCKIVGGMAEFYSSLKPNKGAGDLMNTVAPTWRNFGVSVTDGHTTETSYPRTHYVDPINQSAALLPLVGETNPRLQLHGGLNLINTDVTYSQIEILNSNSALVIAPGRTVTGILVNPNCAGGTKRCAVILNGTKLNYIEGSIRQDNGYALYATGVDFLRIHHLSTHGSGSGKSIDIENSNYGAFSGLDFEGMTGGLLESCSYTKIWNSKFANAASLALQISNGDHNSVADSYFSGNQNGILISGSTNDNAHGLTLANSSNKSVSVGSASVGVSMTSLASLNNLLDIELPGVTGFYGADLFLGTNLLIGPSSAATFSENLLFGAHANCGSPPVGGGLDGSCGNTDRSDATLVDSLDYSASPMGKVTSDTLNRADTAGVSSYHAIDFANWFTFDHWSRMWGLDGRAFSSTDHQGACQSGDTCRIWDWALNSRDTVLRGNGGLGGVSNYEVIGSAACPRPMTGSNLLTDAALGVSYVDAASEVMYDGIGNDNGLCEINEACYFAPNIGAYQGHGAITECMFDDDHGNFPLESAYGFSVNGY